MKLKTNLSIAGGAIILLCLPFVVPSPAAAVPQMATDERVPEVSVNMDESASCEGDETAYVESGVPDGPLGDMTTDDSGYEVTEEEKKESTITQRL